MTRGIKYIFLTGLNIENKKCFQYFLEQCILDRILIRKNEWNESSVKFVLHFATIWISNQRKVIQKILDRFLTNIDVRSFKVAALRRKRKVTKWRGREREREWPLRRMKTRRIRMGQCDRFSI